MKTGNRIALFSLCALTLGLRTSFGDVIIDGFQADHHIQFAQPDFSDAHWSSTLTISVAASSRGSIDFPMHFWPENYGLTFSSSGGVRLDQSGAPAGTAADTLQVTANGAGFFQVHETAGPGTLDSGDPLALFTSTLTGRQDLLFQAPSSSSTVELPAGIPWTTNVFINGDWSRASAGNVQGTHVLLYVDPFWSIQSDFVHNAATDQTLLSVYNLSYLEGGSTSKDDGPYPTFGLIGPVPEPGTLALATIFFLGIGLAGLRRSKSISRRSHQQGGFMQSRSLAVFFSNVTALFLFCLAAKALAGPPPLLDRELFFADPEISNAQISPDGRSIAFLKPFAGTRNVWLKQTGASFSTARPLTGEKGRPIFSMFWSRNSRYVLFTRDNNGDENYNVYAVDVSARPAPGSEIPGARNLTNETGVRAEIFALPRSQPDVIYIGLNDRDKAWHDLYELRISSGKRKLLYKNTDRITTQGAWVFDWNDQLRLATRAAENGDTEILRFNDGKFSKVYSCSVFETCSVSRSIRMEDAFT